MTPIRAQKPSPGRTEFGKLVMLRRLWRAFHERQDRDEADRVFREAGVDLVSDLDLKFFPEIFRQKLNEFGRDWERALAAQALREGFSFYRVQLSIDVEKVNELQRWIEATLEPRGAALFFESNGIQSLSGGVWDAVLYFTFESAEEPEDLGFSSGPGISGIGKILRIV